MVKIVTRLKISRHKGIKKDDGSVSKISPRYLYTLINLDRSFDVKYFLCDCALQNATKRQKLNDSSKTSTLNKIMDFVPLINASWRSCEGQWRVSSVADAIGLSNMYVLSTLLTRSNFVSNTKVGALKCVTVTPILLEKLKTSTERVRSNKGTNTDETNGEQQGDKIMHTRLDQIEKLQY